MNDQSVPSTQSIGSPFSCGEQAIPMDNAKALDIWMHV